MKGESRAGTSNQSMKREREEKTMIKYKEYKQLDGEVRNQVSTVGEGLLRRFDKTPFPVSDTDVVCPHFMLLAWANGCPYNCAWCYLKGTFRFYGQKPNGRIPMVFKTRDRIGKGISQFVADKSLPPEIIDTGELSDSLMDEGTREGSPFSEWIMQFFDGTQHKVMFLTKSTNIQQFLKHEWQKNAILAWSVNSEEVAKKWEMYAPTPQERLAAAREAREAGYEVRLRIDPMVPILGWQDEYKTLVDWICKVEPSRVTLGCLRGLTTTLIYCKDKSWTVYLTEKSNWGKKPPFSERLTMYRTVGDQLSLNGIEWGICKDTLAMWRALGLNFKTVKCNCIW